MLFSPGELLGEFPFCPTFCCCGCCCCCTGLQPPVAILFSTRRGTNQPTHQYPSNDAVPRLAVVVFVVVLYLMQVFVVVCCRLVAIFPHEEEPTKQPTNIQAINHQATNHPATTNQPSSNHQPTTKAVECGGASREDVFLLSIAC